MSHQRNAGSFSLSFTVCKHMWPTDGNIVPPSPEEQVTWLSASEVWVHRRTLQNKNSHQMQVWATTIWLIVAMAMWSLRYRLTARRKETIKERSWSRGGNERAEEERGKKRRIDAACERRKEPSDPVIQVQFHVLQSIQSCKYLLIPLYKDRSASCETPLKGKVLIPQLLNVVKWILT